MSKMNAINTILGVRFDLVDCDRVLRTIDEWRRQGVRRYVTITNPHSVMLCRRDAQMRSATRQAGLTLPDGVGVVAAARMLGYIHRGRVPGPSLMLHCCDYGRRLGLRHYFYGGKEGVPEKLIANFSAAFPGLIVAGGQSPPFHELSEAEDAHAVQLINAARPDVLWVGLGAPKQEKWMAAHLGRVNAAAMIGVGAAFDFHAGTVKWAPAWMRRCGLEWLHRLVREPRRMWRRNVDSPLFLAGVLCQRIARIFGRRQESLE